MRFTQIVEISTGLLGVLTIALFLGFVHGRGQQTEIKNKVNPKGVNTDTMCGAKHTKTGDDAKCVQTCVKNGSQSTLLIDDDVDSVRDHEEELDKLAGDPLTVLGTHEDGKTIGIAFLQPGEVNNSQKSNSAPPSHDSAEPPQASIKGLLRDIACPIQNKAATARTFNLKCALECVRAGSPIVIQADDGTLYLPISSSVPDESQRPRLALFVGKYVEVHGQVFERQGTRAIAVQDIRELKKIPLATDAE